MPRPKTTGCVTSHNLHSMLSSYTGCLHANGLSAIAATDCTASTSSTVCNVQCKVCSLAMIVTVAETGMARKHAKRLQPLQREVDRQELKIDLPAHAPMRARSCGLPSPSSAPAGQRRCSSEWCLPGPPGNRPIKGSGHQQLLGPLLQPASDASE